MGTSDGPTASGRDPRFGGALSAVVSGVRDIVRSRRQGGRPPGHTSADRDRIDGAWCLVTGASSGLGLETAAQLLGRGANLVVASRTAGPDLVRRLRAHLADTEPEGEPAIEAIPVDLASLASVAALVDELARRGRRLDVVVFNAGVVRAGAHPTADGYDEMLQVNYLANHYLATRLVSRGCIAFPGASDATRPPRFVFVSSEAHRSGPDVPAEDPLAVGAYGMRESMRWYGYSKLLLTTFTQELARRHPIEGEQPLTVLTMCPGAMSTSIARDAPGALQPLIRLALRLLFPGPEKSAQTLAHLACSPDLDRSTGRYYHLATEKPEDPRARDRQLAALLWEEAEQAIATASADRAAHQTDG